MRRGEWNAKGQAAVEFLTTYSWALFILFGVIAAIYLLDLGDPDRYATPECRLDSQISCLEAQYLLNTGGNDELNLNLRNNYPKTVTVQDIIVFYGTDKTNPEAVPDLNASNGYTLNPGDEQIVQVSLTNPNNLVSDDVMNRMSFSINFTPISSTNTYQKTGYLVVAAQN